MMMTVPIFLLFGQYYKEQEIPCELLKTAEDSANQRKNSVTKDVCRY